MKKSSNDFFGYIQKSPRLFDGNSVTDGGGGGGESIKSEQHSQSQFWESYIGSCMTFMRKDATSTKTKTPRKTRRHSVGFKHPAYQFGGGDIYAVEQPKNTEVLYMKVILSARQSDNVFCMVRVYNTEGQNIIDKWVIKKRAQNIIEKWYEMHPDTDTNTHFAPQDQIKNYANLEDINSDDSISPRSPRTPPSLKKPYKSAIDACSQSPTISFRTKSRSHIVRRDHFRPRSNTVGGIKKSPFTLSLTDILKPKLDDTVETSKIN